MDMTPMPLLCPTTPLFNLSFLRIIVISVVRALKVSGTLK